MRKMIRYYVIQVKKNGRWVDCFTRGNLRVALDEYRYMSAYHRDEKYRIAKGTREVFEW